MDFDEGGSDYLQHSVYPKSISWKYTGFEKEILMLKKKSRHFWMLTQKNNSFRHV